MYSYATPINTESHRITELERLEGPPEIIKSNLLNNKKYLLIIFGKMVK